MLFCPPIVQIILSEDQGWTWCLPQCNIKLVLFPKLVSPSCPQFLTLNPVHHTSCHSNENFRMCATKCVMKCMKWHPGWFFALWCIGMYALKCSVAIDLLPDLDNVSHLGDCHICICVCICICVWYLCVYLCIYKYTYIQIYVLVFDLLPDLDNPSRQAGLLAT